MNIQNAAIIVSAVWTTQYPTTKYPEIAFAGRSNVGKSSFINKLLLRKGLARTSTKPGKTAQLNFYNIDDTIYFVDLPGYGYAAVSKGEKKKWRDMINEYLSNREQLIQTVLIVDSRHKPTADDIQMLKWIKHRHGSAIVIATKIDKLSKKEAPENLELIYQTLKLNDNDILIPFSAETGLGRKDAWEAISYALGISSPTDTEKPI